MAVLSRDAILDAVKRKDIIIDDFDEKFLGPASYDLTLASEFRHFKPGQGVLDVNTDYKDVTEKITLEEGKSYILSPHQCCLAITKERITLSPSICGLLEGRSRFARLGLFVHITAGFMNPGISNQQVLEIYNASNNPIALTPGTKICQFVFMNLEGEAKYVGKFENQPIEKMTDIEQWVNKVIAFSSEYSNLGSFGGWSANHVCGKPRVYPNYGDNRQAWAPQKPNGEKEYLEVLFDIPVFINKIEIYETFNPGSVIKISAFDTKLEVWVTLWEWKNRDLQHPQQQKALMGRSRIFCPLLEILDSKVNQIRIDLDTTYAESWSEIDAIKVSGNPFQNGVFQKSEAYSDETIEQWVHHVIDYSSEYSGWPATNVIGPSNTYPNYGDLRTAWAPHRSKGEFEYLVLAYKTPVYINCVEIYETYNPGAIFKISCRNGLMGWDEIWSGKPNQLECIGKSRIFKPELKEMDYVTNIIRIDMDTRGSASWSEIDAIKLCGNPYDKRKKVIWVKIFCRARGFDVMFNFQ